HADTSCAKLERMKNSPSPVQDTAQTLESANVPAPMIGDPPTRPQRLPVRPPLEVAAARLPFRLQATAPTVLTRPRGSLPTRLPSADDASALRKSSRAARAPGVSK